MKFWVRFAEKYGSPWVIGKHPRGTAQGEIDLLLDSMEAMVEDAVAAIPDDSSIEIKEAAGKADSSDIYQNLITLARSEISIALLGQNQTTEANSNRASAQAGLEVTDDIRDADADIVESAVNQAIRMAVSMNFGDVASPVWKMWEQGTVDDTRQPATRNSAAPVWSSPRNTSSVSTSCRTAILTRHHRQSARRTRCRCRSPRPLMLIFRHSRTSMMRWIF
jgi:phage gp29-like protein